MINPGEWEELTPHKAYNGWTLQQLLDLASERGLDPSDVAVDYVECGSHEVVLRIRQRSTRSE